ncbi:MAG: hypothetical protein HC802_11995 [Caldilineaceae bacterium]|nr:hypothetical protein [Caldilineaceae bacterium]
MYTTRGVPTHRRRYTRHDLLDPRRLSRQGRVRTKRRAEQSLLPFVLLSIYLFLLFSWLANLAL